MLDLPFEVKTLVVQELKLALNKDLNPPDKLQPSRTVKLSSYAGINSSWNAAIERETFTESYIGASELSYFDRLMARDGGRRRASLRNITLSVTRQSLLSASKEELDEDFSETTDHFFKIVAAWNGPVAPKRKLVLISPVDADLDPDEVEHALDHHEGKQYRRYVGDTLPSSPFTQLFVAGCLQIWPPSLLQIMKAAEGIEGLNLTSFKGPWTIPLIRQEYHDALGEALVQIPKSCTSFVADLALELRQMDGEHNPVRDGLSIGLRDLSTRLRILHLYRMRITPALFWPGDDEQRTDSPAWSSLEDIKVWYLELEACGDSFVDDDRANNDLVNDLYVATGRAAQRMPSLQTLQLALIDSPLTLNLSFAGTERHVAFRSNQHLNLNQDVLEAWGIVESAGNARRDEYSLLDAKVTWNT